MEELGPDRAWLSQELPDTRTGREILESYKEFTTALEKRKGYVIIQNVNCPDIHH